MTVGNIRRTESVRGPHNNCPRPACGRRTGDLSGAGLNDEQSRKPCLERKQSALDRRCRFRVSTVVNGCKIFPGSLYNPVLAMNRYVVNAVCSEYCLL